MIFYIIGFSVFFVGIFDFKKGFLLFLLFKVLLNMYITILAVPGLPTLSMDVGLSMWYIFLFIYKRKKFICREPFPLRIPFIMIIVSWTMSSIFSVAGFSKAVSELVKDVCLEVLFIWVMWYVVKTRKEFDFLIKGFIVLFFLSTLYGFFEYSVKSNPLMDYEISISGSEDMVNFGYGEEGRGYRVRSIFMHAIGGGVNWSIFISFILTLVISLKQKVPFRGLALITVALSLSCIFFTNSRGPLVFLFISAFCYISLADRRNIIKYIPLLILVICVIISYIPEDLMLNFYSIFSGDGNGGSDEETRLIQLSASFKLLSLSPVLGLGYKFMSVVNSNAVGDLFGLESIWFKTITHFGIVGIIATLCLAYYSIWKLPRHFKSRPAAFIALAYWVVISLTSLPGVLIHFYYIVYFYFLRFSSTRELQQQNGVKYVNEYAKQG